MIQLKDIYIDLDLPIVGEMSIDICGIAMASEANENDIAIVLRKEELKTTNAKVILIKPGIYNIDKTLIFSMDVWKTAIDIAKWFIEKNIYSDYSKPVNYKILDNQIALGQNVFIGNNTYVNSFTNIGNNVSIGSNCYIGSNVSIGSDVKIGDNVVINDGCRIGANSFAFTNIGGERIAFPGIKSVIIKNNVAVGYNTIIQRGLFSDTYIDDCVKISDLVGIGHDVHVGKNTFIMGQVGIGGNVNIGDDVTIYAQAGIKDGVCIGNKCIIYAKSGITKSVSDKKYMAGFFGIEYKDEMKIQCNLRRSIRRK